MKKLLISLLSTLVVVSSVEAGWKSGLGGFAAGTFFGAAASSRPTYVVEKAPVEAVVVEKSTSNRETTKLKRKLEAVQDDLDDAQDELRAAKAEIKKLKKQLEETN